jgi:hypothetical protein
MSPSDSLQHQRCQTCEVADWGGDGSLIPVWENPADYNRGTAPDYLGCTDCGTMEEYNDD